MRDLRRYYLSGGLVGEKPQYARDIEDAQLLGVKPWEVQDVPEHWRVKARVVAAAQKQALMEVAKKNKAMPVYKLEL